MIPESRALALFASERRKWRRRELNTLYVEGVLAGLLIASQIVAQLWIETKKQFKQNPAYLGACFSNLNFRKRSHGH